MNRQRVPRSGSRWSKKWLGRFAWAQPQMHCARRHERERARKRKKRRMRNAVEVRKGCATMIQSHRARVDGDLGK